MAPLKALVGRPLSAGMLLATLVVLIVALLGHEPLFLWAGLSAVAGYGLSGST